MRISHIVLGFVLGAVVSACAGYEATPGAVAVLQPKEPVPTSVEATSTGEEAVTPSFPNRGAEETSAPTGATRGVPELDDRLLHSSSKGWSWAGFSPDGSRVGWSRSTGGLASDLYVGDVKTGETRFVSHDVVTVFSEDSVRFSRDGRYLVYRVTLDGGAGSWHDLGELWAWDWETEESWLIGDNVLRSAVNMRPGGEGVLYVASQNKTLRYHHFDGREDTEIDVGIWTTTWSDPQSILPIGPLGERFAYTRGSQHNASVYVADFDTLSPDPRGGGVEARSVRFDETGGWLTWQEQTPDPNTHYVAVHHRLSDGVERRSEPGRAHVPSANSARVAYLLESDHSNTEGELQVWSRIPNTAVTLGDAVRPGTFAFSEDGAHLTWLSDIERVGTIDVGELWVADLETHEVTHVDSSVLYHYAFPPQFAPNGELVYATGSCPGSTLHGWTPDAEAPRTLTTGLACRNLSFTAMGGLIAWRETPSQLQHIDLDTGVKTKLADRPHQLMATPSRTRSVWITRAWSGAKRAFAYNHATGGAAAVVEDKAAGLRAISETHLVYDVNSGKRYLRLMELP